MFSRFKREAISFAFSLMLILIWPQGSMACSSVYKFMSELWKEDAVSKVDKVIYDACSPIKFESMPSIQWNELSKRIFWPLQGSLSKEFIISNNDMPDVAATFKVAKIHKKGVRGQRCDEFEISIAGEKAQPRVNDIGNLDRGIQVQGMGKALICQNGSFPRAASMQLKRTIEPTLWSSLDHKVEEEIEIAWSVMP